MSPLVQRALPTHGILNTARLLPAASTIQLLNLKSIHMTFVHCSNSSPTTTVPTVQLGYVQRMLKKIGALDLQKYVIEISCIKI